MVEIEIPQGHSSAFTGTLISLFSTIGLMVLGFFISPTKEDSFPVILTPRLAKISQYQGQVLEWVQLFRQVGEELSTFLGDEGHVDIFTENNRVNKILGVLHKTLEEIDQTEVPPTMEGVHDTVTTVSTAYLDVTYQVANWLNEPTVENQRVAQDGLNQARQQFSHLKKTPWIQVTQE